MKQPCQKWQGCWFYGSRKDAGGMPDKSLGRSIAPRGSSRSNCQIKAILHGGIETGAEMRGRAQRSGTEGVREMPDNIRRNRNRGRDAGRAQRERNGGEAGVEREAFCCNFDLLSHK